MRVDFVKSVFSIFTDDPQAIFITGDLGFMAFEELRSEFPRRFINAGVAEQNMIGMAAGIVLGGKKPWVYSIVPFAVYRCFEQIRNDICLHQLPVRLVGNGGGFTYGIMGSTHHGLEDLGVLKTLPNIELFFPCSNDQVNAIVKKIQSLQKPCYLRLGISGFPSSFKYLSENQETLTRHYCRGNSVTVVGIGHATQIVTTALEQLDLASQDVDVFGLSRFPLNLVSDSLFTESILRTRLLVVVEEHYSNGSIGESLLKEFPSLKGFQILCAKYSNSQRYGSPRFLLEQCGLTPLNVQAAVSQLKSL